MLGCAYRDEVRGRLLAVGQRLAHFCGCFSVGHIFLGGALSVDELAVRGSSKRRGGEVDSDCGEGERTEGWKLGMAAAVAVL